MNEQLREAIERFNAENEKTEKAEAAINTLISCFGDADVDVVRHTMGLNEIAETYVQGYLTRDTPEERVEALINFFKTIREYWDIIIKFPHETITNEFGRQVDIYDFFVKVSITHRGTLLNTSAIKASYTEDQFYSGYVHSHCPSMYHSSQGIAEWKSMCFGSGPINDTMSILRYDDYDERVWIAFASELRQWVRTESTDGGPYFRMERISNQYEEVKSTSVARPTRIDLIWLKPLLLSYIRAERIKIGYVGEKYCLGTPFTEWLMDFSRYAEVWGKKNNVQIPMVDTLIINNKICTILGSTNRRAYTSLIGLPVLTFKGESINLKIVGGEKVEHTNLIAYRLGLYIVRNILNVINHNYGRTETTDATVPIQWG